MTARLSLTGKVLAMHATAVKPPAAAARVPLAMVSLYSKPGSRRCTCMSMKPGHTTLPVASTVSAPAGGFRPLAHLVDAAVDDPDVLDRVGAAGRIDHAPALDQQVHAPLLPASM